MRLPRFVRTCPVTGQPCTRGCPVICTIQRTKLRALDAYLRMRTAEIGADCGTSLLEHISPSYARDKAEFDRLMTTLREIDPTMEATLEWSS